jgi:cell division protein FtsI (penicillin-binding protein 3)
MSGVVFHHIAEGVMAQNLKRSVDAARDASSIMTPDVKRGDNSAASYVLASLKTKASSNSSTNYRESSKHTVPDVTGMGAKDAVYLLESRHVKARVKGRGKVKSQSIHAGTAIKQGMVCELTLD